MDSAVAALESVSLPIAWSFGLSLTLAAALYLLVHVTPSRMVRFSSVPWAFQLRKSTDLRYQAVLYKALHTHRWARVSHYSLAWDQLFWFALLGALHPAAVLVTLSLLLIQATLLRTTGLTAALAIAWLAVAALGWVLVELLGTATAGLLSMAAVVFGGVLRVLGHVFEPIPPGIAKEGSFVPLREAGRGINVLAAPFVGFVCEFAAGFPFRLVLVQALWLGERAGLRAPAYGTREEHLRDARKVLDGGWAASPVTSWMIQPELGR